MYANGAAVAILKIRTHSGITEFFGIYTIHTFPFVRTYFDIDIRTDKNTIFVNTDAPFKAEFFDSETLLNVAEAPNGCCSLTINNPTLWTVETPYLYTVKLYAAGEEITRKTGFRTVEIFPNSELLINGQLSMFVILWNEHSA